jgi:hypothetical protein
MKLEPGMLITTNYSGPYRIKKVIRNCTCQSYLDTINHLSSPSQPHIHLVCTRPDGTGEFFLNRWDETSLKSLQRTCCGGKKEVALDWLTVLENDQPVQGTLF